MQNILEKFFEYLYDETFEDGATYFASQSQIPLTLFCSSFLMAKHKVEISYAYSESRALYKKAAEAIRSMDAELFISLAEFADLQAAILRIDRGIYTGYASLMSESAYELQAKTESILKILDNVNIDSSNPCYRVLQDNLVEKVKEDNIYAKAVIVVAEAYLSRWNKSDNLDIKLNFVQNAVIQLEEMGNERLASDLAPHIHVIKRFEDRRGNDGKLFIKNGKVAFYYYGTLDYRIREEFNSVLLKISKGDADLSVKLEELLGSNTMVAEEMTDIWSGLASIEFIDTYKFRLNNIKIASFRKIENLEADVELKYYTMGIFEIKISFLIDNDYLLQNADGLSLSALRHLQSLGTPFALDENIMVENSDEKYQYLAEYVDTKFEKLGINIVDLLQGSPDVALLPEKKAITYNSEQNRFALVRINQIVEDFGDRVVRLHLQDFEKHFQYKALVMPVREVRSAIDNWIMYDSHVIDENLASIRYNESEWLSLNLHHGVVALLEQPVWVFDQAIESIEVALAVLNLLNLSNIQASTQLKNISKGKENIEVSLKAKKLKGLKTRLESEIGQLDDFKEHLTNLLETVEAGSMMTYPDHTIFMEELFRTISLEKQKKKALTLQTELKDKRSKSMETIKKINEAVAFSQQKVIKLVVSIASVFITLGSLIDLFQLWNDSKSIQSLGLADTDGNFKLYFVLVLAVASTFWLVYDNYIRDKKE